jgi:23S rRNA (cytosine1962-C5)-methyltransferase
MFAADQYQLLDFGQGRKLERFGPYILDRPAPACSDAAPRLAECWADATAHYERSCGEQGVWLPPDALPDRWCVVHRQVTLELRPTSFGHLGLFPEQAENWLWLANRVSRSSRALDVLHLFAYTGGSTLACAASGARVVHVDAARNVVQWARRNAALSGLATASIRWLVEDATTFVARECRRGKSYDAVVLDPPSYGHGPRGESWQIDTDLLPLLTGCRQLVRDRESFGLLTCHSPGWGPDELRRLLRRSRLISGSSEVQAGELHLTCSDGRRLSAGTFVRWSA